MMIYQLLYQLYKSLIFDAASGELLVLFLLIAVSGTERSPVTRLPQTGHEDGRPLRLCLHCVVQTAAAPRPAGDLVNMNRSNKS